MAKSITSSRTSTESIGSLDLFFHDVFFTNSSSTFTSGNDPVFNNGGVLVGTLSDELASPISGSSSVKYTQAGGSLGDWIASREISLDLKVRGNTLGHIFYFTYTGNADEIEVIVYDNINLTVLTSSVDILESTSKGTRFETSFTPPANCTSLKYGFRVKTENIGATLIFDEVEMSSNPFTYKQLIDDSEYFGGKLQIEATALIANADIVLAQDTNKGSGTYNAGTGEWTCGKAGDYRISLSHNYRNSQATAGQYFYQQLKINGTIYKRAESRFGLTVLAAIDSKGASTSFIKYLEVGDVLKTSYSSGGAWASGQIATEFNLKRVTVTTQHVIAPAKTNLTDWTSFTPVINGLTYSSHTMEYRRDGSDMLIRGNIELSSTVSTTIELKLPENKVFNGDAHSLFGTVVSRNGSVFHDGSARSATSTGNIYGTSGMVFNTASGTGANVWGLASPAVWASADRLYFSNVRVPIEGWSSDLTFLAAIPTNYQNVNPNGLMNGDMRVNQRENLPLTEPDGGIANLTVDRFRTYSSGVARTTTLETSLQPLQLSGSKSLKIKSTTVAPTPGYLFLGQKVEDFGLYAGKTVTASAWIKSNNVNARVRIYDGVGEYQGAPHSGSGGWEFLTLTCTINQNTTSIDVQYLTFDNGDVNILFDDYIEFTGAKLELGSEATEFVADSYGDSLRKCQRYCEVLFEDAKDYAYPASRASTTAMELSFTYRVTKYKDLNTLIAVGSGIYGRDVGRTATYNLTIANVTNFALSSSGDRHNAVLVLTTIAQPTGLSSSTFDTIGSTRRILVESEL